MLESNGRTKRAYRANFKYCFVSPDEFGLKMGDWYTADELSAATGVSSRLIANRIYSSSYLCAGCDIVRSEQIARRNRQKKKMFLGYALENYHDWISSHWLRRPI